MHWFKHDSDANQDAKLQNVMLDYGLEGYGLYWYCIELIASKVSVDNITFELEHDARIIARNTGCTTQKVEEMMRYFVKVGLFECANNTISCLKLAKRLDKSMTSNPQMREIIGNFKNHDAVMMESGKVMQDKIRLDKSIKHISESEIPVKQSPKGKEVPIAELVEIYNDECTSLPKVQTWTSKQKRISQLKARWIESKDRQNLEWWREFFRWCNTNESLNGSKFEWIADLEAITNPSKFTRLLEKGAL